MLNLKTFYADGHGIRVEHDRPRGLGNVQSTPKSAFLRHVSSSADYASHPLQLDARVRRRVSGHWLGRAACGTSVTRRYVADLTPKLDSLSLDRSQLPGYLRIWGISLVAAFVVVAFVFGMPPVALAAVYLVYVAPRIILDFMIRRRRALLRDQMVTATIALANTSRAGLSLRAGTGNGRQRNARAAGRRAPPHRARVQARPAAARSAARHEGPAQHRQLHAVLRRRCS